MAFQEKGTVVRMFVAKSGKFARLTLDIPNDRGSIKIPFVTFDCTSDFAPLRKGDEVELSGRIGIEKLTDKNRRDVQVDGYTHWQPQLVVTSVKPSKVAPAKPDNALSGSDDDIAF